MNFNPIQITKYVINIGSIMVPFLAYFFIELKGLLWDLTLITLIILMLIRPINDIFPSLKFYRFLTLRKNLGIFSATIIVSYGAIHYFSMSFGEFLSTYFSLAYWTFKDNLFFAHIGELTGVILLITSNTFSIRLLKGYWKKVQRLSYVYFVCGSWYVFSSFGKTYALIGLIVVLEITIFAYFKKKMDREMIQQNNTEQIKTHISN